MKQIFHGHTRTPKERISRIGVSTIFLLLSLASLAVSQSSAPRVAVQRCNKVILGYFRDTIKFHEYPIIDTWVRACDDEYANYKGCCDTDSLREMMKKFVMSDALRWNNALVKVNLFDKEVVKNSAALKAKIDKFRPELQKRVEAKTLNSSVVDSANYLSTFLPLMTNTTYLTRLEAYKGQAQACFDTITQIRKGAMCIICSSRATQFYKNQIMNIKQSTCDAVVRDCYANFQFMFTVVTTLQSLFEVANAVNPEANFPLGTDPVPTKSKTVF